MWQFIVMWVIAKNNKFIHLDFLLIHSLCSATQDIRRLGKWVALLCAFKKKYSSGGGVGGLWTPKKLLQGLAHENEPVNTEDSSQPAPIWHDYTNLEPVFQA